jgi:hypothetical protein
MNAMAGDASRLESARTALVVGLISGALLMTELALTRIFSVTLYYHFAFLAISIALFGLSASGVYVYVAGPRLARWSTSDLLASHALVYIVVTAAALALLVRVRVGLTYSPANLALMLALYGLAGLPFLAGGAVISIALARLTSRVGVIYGADLVGAAAGCLLLRPLMDRLGAPGVILATLALAGMAVVLALPPGRRVRLGFVAGLAMIFPWILHGTGLLPYDVVGTKGHAEDRILFSKWNSFSRVAVYDRAHGDWSLSPRYEGPLPETRFMDIDSAASTPIVRVRGDLTEAQYLKYELTALAYHFVSPVAGFKALVIGPGGGRDLLAALVFGAARVDAVEINPIIVHDVMLGRFHDYSGRIYAHPRVRVSVDDGRAFVRRAGERYDVIQASLVDTWAATAAGAYTLTENSLYTVEAFEEYLGHLSDNGVLTITRWVFDGLRLVSLAQEACARQGAEAAERLIVVQEGQVATLLLKRTPFTPTEVARLVRVTADLGFTLLYAPRPGAAGDPEIRTNDYARLILAGDRDAFFAAHPRDLRATTDDRPFFFHTTKLKDQVSVAFGRSMLFGNGLSALMSLMAISAGFVLLFVLGPLALSRRNLPREAGWMGWLAYFAALGAGFMLIEVALLQRFVLLLGHPSYSLSVTLFSLLLGTGIGSFWTRTFPDDAVVGRLVAALALTAVVGAVAGPAVPALVDLSLAASRPTRILLAATMLVPLGILMGVPLPAGVRVMTRTHPHLVPWAWGMNGAFSVVGATVAVFVAMNWGFSRTLLAGSLAYVVGLVVAAASVRRSTALKAARIP